MMFDDIWKYKFKWNPDKDMRNRRKHRVSFSEASTVFYHDEAEIEFDREQDGEDRYAITGISDKGRIVRVVFTLRGWNERTIRIITAKRHKAEGQEP